MKGNIANARNRICLAVAIVALFRLHLGVPSAKAAGLAFKEALFMATHNSYAKGQVGSIKEQLNSGVRLIELDICDEQFAQHKDYLIGHSGPGDDVQHGNGNPDSLKLTDWLEVIKQWSDEHRGHGPIIVVIDVKGAIVGELGLEPIKTGLADNTSFADGNLSFLNASIRKVFGASLFSAENFHLPWPTTEALKNKFLVVLSGDLSTRKAYRWDTGNNPAVGMNSKGQVIELHDSGAFGLWYWAGEYRANGSVTWHRHGKYDTGSRPAVAINDDGLIVAVHQDELGRRLFYQVGRMTSDFEVIWSTPFSSRPYDAGCSPTISFEPQSSNVFKEIHKSALTGQNWKWRGTLDPIRELVTWTNNERTLEGQFDKTHASINEREISVFSMKVDVSQQSTLLYRTLRVQEARVCYEQVAFVEHQRGLDGSLLRDGALFCAASADKSNIDWALNQRRNGKLVRLWQVKEESGLQESKVPPAQFPATDTPKAQWYLNYMSQIGVQK